MRTSGCSVANPTTVMTRPEARAPTNPTESSLAARASLCLPSSRLMELPAPLPKKNPMAWITVITLKAMPMAPDCAVPRRPMKNVSDRL